MGNIECRALSRPSTGDSGGTVIVQVRSGEVMDEEQGSCDTDWSPPHVHPGLVRSGLSDWTPMSLRLNLSILLGQ